MPAMTFPTMPDPPVDRDRDHDRRHPERETLLLAATGAAQVLGVDHSVTKALARASITMAKVDLWHARLAVKTLRRGRAGHVGQGWGGEQAQGNGEGAHGRLTVLARRRLQGID